MLYRIPKNTSVILSYFYYPNTTVFKPDEDYITERVAYFTNDDILKENETELIFSVPINDKNVSYLKVSKKFVIMEEK